MNGDDDDRTDFGVQTSLDSTLANLTKENATSRLSDNGNHSPTPSPSDLRQRRSRFSSSTPVGPIRSTSAYLSVGHKSPQCSPLAFPPNSPLRRAVAKNRDAFGSLGKIDYEFFKIIKKCRTHSFNAFFLKNNSRRSFSKFAIVKFFSWPNSWWK